MSDAEPSGTFDGKAIVKLSPVARLKLLAGENEGAPIVGADATAYILI